MNTSQTPWQRLIANQAKSTLNLQVLKKTDIDFQRFSRGIRREPPGSDNSSANIFKVGESVAVVYYIPDSMLSKAQAGNINLLLVNVDNKGSHCLYPGSSSEQILGGLNYIRIPQGEDWWHMHGPEGEQRLIALLTTFPLTDLVADTFDRLADDHLPRLLDEVAEKIDSDIIKVESPTNSTKAFSIEYSYYTVT